MDPERTAQQDWLLFSHLEKLHFRRRQSPPQVLPEDPQRVTAVAPDFFPETRRIANVPTQQGQT